MGLWKEDSSLKEVGRGRLKGDNSIDFEVADDKRNKVQREKTIQVSDLVWLEAWSPRERTADWQSESAEPRTVTEQQSGSLKCTYKALTGNALVSITW